MLTGLQNVLSRYLVKLTFQIIGPESDKRDFQGIEVKINVLRPNDRTGFDEHFLKI